MLWLRAAARCGCHVSSALEPEQSCELGMPCCGERRRAQQVPIAQQCAAASPRQRRTAAAEAAAALHASAAFQGFWAPCSTYLRALDAPALRVRTPANSASTPRPPGSDGGAHNQ